MKHVKAIEGWIIIATNIHEEASEEDVTDFFGEWGQVENLHLNLDRRTGYVKGYALIEYPTYDEALQAVNEANNVEFLGQTLSVAFAFVTGPSESTVIPTARPRRRRNRSNSRSISPERSSSQSRSPRRQRDSESRSRTPDYESD